MNITKSAARLLIIHTVEVNADGAVKLYDKYCEMLWTRPPSEKNVFS